MTHNYAQEQSQTHMTCPHTRTQSPRLNDPYPWSLTVCPDGVVMAK